ncbi:PASTA domain-containing protein [Kribbella sp. NPDC002412]
MNESKLTDLLDRAAERTTVGPPPIDAMHAHATRVRRRRTVAVCVTAAVAVVAAAGGTALLTRPSASVTPPQVASTSPQVAPTETRLVGLGHAAIPIPKNWGTDRTHCLTPYQDTVILARDGHLCATPRPSGVESVQLGLGTPTLFEFTADENVEIDGVPAERQRTTCTDENIGEVRTCSGVVRIPSLDTWFWAESSTNAAEVDRILSWIQIVPNRVGVPDEQAVRGGSGSERAGQTYAAALTRLGLTPKIQPKKSSHYLPGDVLSVSPAPGTMLAPGATVTLTVAAR